MIPQKTRPSAQYGANDLASPGLLKLALRHPEIGSPSGEDRMP